MSYDLIGFRLAEGEDVEAALERLEALAAQNTPPTDEEWQRILDIGEALAAVNPTAERTENRESGAVELTTPRFQVAVHAHEAAITIPYWSDGGSDDDSMPEDAARFVPVLREVGGFTIWDPQMERRVETDAEKAIRDGYGSSAG